MKLEYTNEVWKDIPGYEGLYRISNLGRVKSLCDRWKKERILKTTKNKLGYLKISLTKDRVEKTFFVHRLIAQAFLPNPEDKPCVDHIDGNPSNCVVFNLRWVTVKENSSFELARKHNSDAKTEMWSNPEYKAKMLKIFSKPDVKERKSSAQKLANAKPEVRLKKRVTMINNPKISKPVCQYTKDGVFVAVYPSAAEAERQTGINHSGIAACCLGRPRKSTCGGYIWRYDS